ncbi:MAG: hypothetical protein J4A00_10975, partial [Gammaproteobacteria bacterium]|nr:hypothetical protein [Gammaproteobacteria bacterium]
TVADCSTLLTAGASATGLWWIEGDCDMNGGTVGSRSDPVIIVTEGDLRFAGGVHVWGLVYGLDRPYGTNTFQNAGTVYMHGALVFEGNMNNSGGTFNAMYDPTVFDALFTSDTFNRFGAISGSWFDAL